MTPGLAIVGAGSVGLSLTARLAASGCDVWLVARREESVGAIAVNGIEVFDPGSDERFTARPTGVSTLESANDLPDRIVIVCVRAPDSASLAPQLAEAAPGATVVCAQNDVDNEAHFAPQFDSVVGGVVRQTCTRTAPARVSALGGGRIIFGGYPNAASATRAALDGVDFLSSAFARAGFDVATSSTIREDKWLKLCVNLLSVPNALIHPDEHTLPEFGEIKARLAEEARAAIAAAGIDARSCDGRDRSLDEEIAFQRESPARGQSARRLPIYNAVWASLEHGLPLEAELYHERILALARQHGLAAPLNQRALDLVLRARRERLGPESARCADFLRTAPLDQT